MWGLILFPFGSLAVFPLQVGVGHGRELVSRLIKKRETFPLQVPGSSALQCHFCLLSCLGFFNDLCQEKCVGLCINSLYNT